jgi:diguanylate cyclase (GGDEF)-like protein
MPTSTSAPSKDAEAAGVVATDPGLFTEEEQALRQADEMVASLERMTLGMSQVAGSIRQGYHELRRLLHMSDRLQLDLQQANRALEEQRQELARVNAALGVEMMERQRLAERLREMTVVDELTTLHNRRYLNEVAEEVLAVARSHGQDLGVMVIDIDNFKEVNDTLGHAAGDEVLRHLALKIRACLREGDVGARIGGDEFLILMPGLSAERIRQVVERLRAVVALEPAHWQGRALPFTLSVGYTVAEGRDPGFAAVYARADACLYEAKRGGRDRLVGHGASAGDGPCP